VPGWEKVDGRADAHARAHLTGKGRRKGTHEALGRERERATSHMTVKSHMNTTVHFVRISIVNVSWTTAIPDVVDG